MHTARSICSSGWSIRQKLAWYLETNTSLTPWQRHSGSNFFSSFFSSHAFSVSSPDFPIPPFLLSLQSFPALSSSFHSPCLFLSYFLRFIIKHNFTFPSCFLFLLHLPFSSPLLSLCFGLGTGAPLLNPQWFILLNLTIYHMSIRRRQLSPLRSPTFLGPPRCSDQAPSVAFIQATGEHFAALGRQSSAVPGGNVACLDNLIY